MSITMKTMIGTLMARGEAPAGTLAHHA